MEPDEAVIQAVLGGETDRYAELVDRYRSAALNLAFSFVGDAEDAKELSQNGFVKAYRSLRRFRGRARFSTWLYRIVANECKDHLRRKAREPQRLPLFSGGIDSDGEAPPAAEPADPSVGPRQAASDREMAEAIRQAAEKLPMKQRTAFVLHYMNGLTAPEIAEIMGTRPGTVKSHLFRAAEAIRIQMEPLFQEVQTA